MKRPHPPLTPFPTGREIVLDEDGYEVPCMCDVCTVRDAQYGAAMFKRSRVSTGTSKVSFDPLRRRR